MTESCPSCGQLLPLDGARVWTDLNSNDVVVDGDRIRLTARQCELVSALMDAAPSVVSRGGLMDMIYGHMGDEPFEEILGVMICKIRQKLAGTALRIETVVKCGYRVALT